jgi:penicillin-binding protein 1B
VILGAPAVGMAAIAVEALVMARLDEEMFRPPTRIYARPIVLYPGMPLDGGRIEANLQRLGYRRVRRGTVDIGEYRDGSRRWIIGRRAFRLYDRLDPGGVAVVRLGWDGRIRGLEDARGRRLRSVALEPELIGSAPGSSVEDRIPVPLSHVPDHVVNAVLSVEDQHFFEHDGLDLKRIAGAALANVRAMGIVQGASTITQQLAKNLFLSPKRSLIRKIREMAMAETLERRYTKEEILEAYLNQVYLGQDGAVAIHGVGRAAQFYFGKDVSQLDTSEAALLAGIIRGPSLYSPFRHPEAATQRRNLVLALMGERGLLSEDALREAKKAPLGLRDKPERTRVGRYFVDYVAEELAAVHGRKVLERGVSVLTTLDMGLQRTAEDAVRKGLARLDVEYPRLAREGAPLQAALVALDPRSGEIRAMVGGRDYGASQFNRVANAHRQPGSSFKPIVALAALSQGNGYTLATSLRDEPYSLETPVGLWEPSNYDRRFRGSVSLRQALERSLNVPFARLGVDVGPELIIETARNLGLQSFLNPVPSLALGSSEVTPLEMTQAFGVVAANGFRADPHATLGVFGPGGEVLSRTEADGEQVYTAAEAYLVTSALLGAVEHGTGRGLRTFGYRGPVAAKSGTTNDFRDAWFIGYTPSLAVGVWVGFDDGSSIGLPGSRAALPIFARFLVGAVGPDGDGDFFMPWGVEVVEVDAETGLRGGRGCRGEPEVFLTGTAPRTSCSRYWSSGRRSWSSRSRGYTPVSPFLEERSRRGGRRRGR